VAQGEGHEFKPQYCKKKKRHLSYVSWLKPVILATQEAEIGRITAQGQLDQKVHETSSQPSWVPVTCDPNNSGSGQPRHKMRPYLKNNAERAGRVA
jgi:hypothetical protein